ncbi:tRNA lysidine(34) synthetase TilS [Pontibaca salina]|uniref:tRNA lysidine(34) synthetase TilS n=1 Tax=Pontibaca salina TaxID=2795731 RepID=UPI001E58F725|nr:tRNA lysidine(34) synthetase TilS [Pontibaca salina]
MSSADRTLIGALRAVFGANPPARIGVAVSGGGDSVALLHLLTRCFDDREVTLFAATVNHGLRPEAAQEAEDVARLAQQLGISHQILHWHGWGGRGNMQDRARRARYELLADWAKNNEISMVATGHTIDDQAETVLMRLARASGVDGLSAMAERTPLSGITLIRPMLKQSRADLRDYLRRQGLCWAEDPGNEDLAYDRIRVRKALGVLHSLGLTAPKLAQVAANMQSARDALKQQTYSAALQIAAIDGGDVVFALPEFRSLPDEVARRLLGQAIRWVGGGDYLPRRVPLQAAVADLSGTLGGCRILQQKDAIRIAREYEAVKSFQAAPDQAWDGLWRLAGPFTPEHEIRALGAAGLAQCRNWRVSGRPRASLIATPAIWRGDDLIAAPLAEETGIWRAERVGGRKDFLASLLSH